MLRFRSLASHKNNIIIYDFFWQEVLIGSFCTSASDSKMLTSSTTLYKRNFVEKCSNGVKISANSPPRLVDSPIWGRSVEKVQILFKWCSGHYFCRNSPLSGIGRGGYDDLEILQKLYIFRSRRCRKKDILLEKLTRSLTKNYLPIEKNRLFKPFFI